ncbi:hypothetical protein [Streptomyces oceani]|uniref:hypothetical protein n=1 Tax=Streptomyces oceani TaxID=1075402 RepID=UPI000871CADF|nr:hypothetical protein [Streptomyces oceani]
MSRLPGLIVVDDASRPRIVLPGTQVLGLAVPGAYQKDPALTRIVNEEYADTCWLELSGMTVGDALPERPAKPVKVAADATWWEVAALVARLHSPLVAVVDQERLLVGAITLDRL